MSLARSTSITTLVLALALLVAPSTAEAAATCSVKDKATGKTYATLQRAVNAARPKATLLVRGTCRGKMIIRRHVRIEGIETRRWGRPRLHAVGTPVLVVQRGATASAASLLIAKGKGVINRGDATFHDVRVKGASYESVPSEEGKGERRGILNAGTLRLLGASWVRNTSGVVNIGHLTLGGRAYIRGNLTPICDPAVRNAGTFVMKGRSTIGNNICDAGSRGWGAPFLNRGRLVMHHRSSFRGQEGSIGPGRPSVGAIRNLGTIVMHGRSSIHHNYAGAFWVFTDGTGGGVYDEGRLVMRDRSAIHHNTAEHHDHGGRGGGIFNAPGATLVGVRCGPGGNANVYGNAPDDCYFDE